MNSEVISKRSFISVIVILLLMMLVAGVLTQVLPMGRYQRVTVDGQERVLEGSYRELSGERLPIYKWITAPIEVLFSDDAVIIFVIILFLLFISGSISTLNHAGIIEAIIYRIVNRFRETPYTLLAAISLMFMCLGSFIGIFEEIIPLIPIILVLINKMGFDKMTGLGISLLACGLGFSAAVSNPFTIGIAQQLAGVPIFSGALYRILIFVTTYLILMLFVINHAKTNRIKVQINHIEHNKASSKGEIFFIATMVIMLISIICSAFIPFIRDINLIIIALLFIIAAFGSSLINKIAFKTILYQFLHGMKSIIPGVILILLAVSVKHIIVSGNIMDTILFKGSSFILQSSPTMALIYIYLLVLGLNFFIGSGSAKAFIVIPIIMPLLDMMNISRQLGILAFQFGDGFSNIIYPTNAVLLIVLALTDTKILKWIKWIIPIQLLLAIMSILFLVLGIALNY